MYFLQLHTKKIALLIILVITLLGVHQHNISTHFRQNTVWNGPYLSAAANLMWPLSFQVDVEEIQYFNSLNDTKAEDSYQFRRSEHLSPYIYNDLGYAYLIWFAKLLFPFLGDQQSIMLLQALVHLLICGLFIYDSAFSRTWRLCFFGLYFLNPIILKYVVFNHYYFWQSIPSLLVIFLTNRHPRRTSMYVLLALLPWAILARTTTLLLVPVILFLLFRYRSRTALLATLVYCAFVWFLFFVPSQKNIWHAAYIGVGAYQNPFGIQLSDETGLDLYRKKLRRPISASTGGNFYEPSVFAEYKALTKRTLLAYLRSHPLLFLKNSVANSLAAFSIGYLSGQPDWLNYLSSFIGFLFIILLIRFRQWIYLLSMALLAFSFTLYYPPVPAYLFGSYALLMAGMVSVMLQIRQRGKDTILYLSFNDGSDMRVNKELRTLSKKTQVELVALGPDPSQCYARPYLHTLHFVQGARSSQGTLLRYFGTCSYLLLSRQYRSVHIINEPQLLALWPFLWIQKWVVLDLFDSTFLRKNLPGNRWKLIKKLVYAPVSRLIVTDENRLKLLPDSLQSKAVIVPNYPYGLNGLPVKERSPHLTIMYYGWLGEQRGTETIRNLLAADPNLHVLMAGWFADEASRVLTKHPRVEWLGVLPQDKALRLVAQRADYILCVYAPVNDNNINASPNKIYDAIHTNTPVIMNTEVKVADFVNKNGIGYVLSDYNGFDYTSVVADLHQKRESYVFSEELRELYTWGEAEGMLLKAHNIQQLFSKK